jgi:hypothetical protein
MINQQLQGKTDDLVNVFPNHAVLREMVQAEDECGGTIGAGFPAYSHNPQPVDPEKLKQAMQKVRLLSLLFSWHRVLDRRSSAANPRKFRLFIRRAKIVFRCSGSRRVIGITKQTNPRTT